MRISNERAIEIFDEILNMNYVNFDEFYDNCRNILINLARRNNYNLNGYIDEEDFAQDVIIRCIEKGHTFNSKKGAFSTWMGTIAKNIYNDYYKEEIKDLEFVSMTEENSNVIDFCVKTDTVEKSALLKNDVYVLLEEIKNLKENYKQALELCVVQQKKPKEAAVIMKCSEKDVYRWKNRALNNLNKKARELGFNVQINGYRTA